MPKEIIEDRHSTAEGPHAKVQVGWSREAEHVQVATVAPDSWLHDQRRQGNGWFVTLDRDQINSLIRTLRKARDQAFGADA
jgi:hypothetical protein